jgi:hypothetical protein
VSRYFTAPRAKRPRAEWWDDQGPLLPNLHVPDHEAADTGLLDADGNTIWRAPNPMGFIWESGRE